jgi:hypothetical protein
MCLLYIIVSLLMLQGKAIQMLPNEHALGPKIMSNLVHKPLARVNGSYTLVKHIQMSKSCQGG